MVCENLVALNYASFTHWYEYYIETGILDGMILLTVLLITFLKFKSSYAIQSHFLVFKVISMYVFTSVALYVYDYFSDAEVFVQYGFKIKSCNSSSSVPIYNASIVEYTKTILGTSGRYNRRGEMEMLLWNLLVILVLTRSQDNEIHP